VTIVHILTSLNIGGLEILVCNLATVSASQPDHKVHVLIINDVFEGALLEKLERSGVQVIRLGRKPGNPLTILWFAMKLRAAIETIKPDILHVHNNLGSLMTSLATRFLAIPIVYTLHARRLYPPSSLNRLLKAIAWGTTARFIANSNAVKDDFSAGASRSDRIVVVPNGVKLDDYTPRQGTLPLARKILCVASLKHEIKGQDILIRAVSLLKKEGYMLQCIFAGEGESREYLQTLTKECGVADRVRFLGLRSDVPALLTAADLFVLPSRSEGFGIVIIEAMASGVPVVVADVDGPREIVEDSRTGLYFKSGSEHDLAGKIRLLIEDSDLRTRLSQAALQASEAYSINGMCNRYLAIYNGLMPAAGSRE
jgi:glycosyltransferase involved in cell wall biosynthesis